MSAAAPQRRGVERRLLLAAVVVAAVVAALVAGGVATELANQSPGTPVQHIITTTTGGGVTVNSLALERQNSVVTVLTQPVSVTSLLVSNQGVANGVVVGSGGLVLTTAHAVEGATQLRIATADGRTYDAVVAATDPLHGEVLLRAEGATGLSPVSIRSTPPNPGDDAVLLALSPLAALQVGVGTVRGAFAGDGPGGAPLTGADSIDIAADASYEGAPIFNGNGALMGVATVQSTPSASVIMLSGQAASSLLASLEAGGGLVSFGAGYVLLDPGVAALLGTEPGAVLTTIIPGGPAATSGLAVGDVVTAANGTPVDQTHPLEPSAFGLQAGAVVSVSVRHAGTAETVSLTLNATTP